MDASTAYLYRLLFMESSFLIGSPRLLGPIWPRISANEETSRSPCTCCLAIFLVGIMLSSVKCLKLIDIRKYEARKLVMFVSRSVGASNAKDVEQCQQLEREKTTQ